MISNRLITEECMNQTSDFNETTTLTYSLPTKKNILVDISMQKPCWQVFIRKIEIGKIGYVSIKENMENLTI